MQTKSRINKTFKKLFFIIFLGDNKMTIKSLLCSLDFRLEKPFLEQDMQKCPNPRERMLEKFCLVVAGNIKSLAVFKEQVKARRLTGGRCGSIWRDERLYLQEAICVERK